MNKAVLDLVKEGLETSSWALALGPFDRVINGSSLKIYDVEDPTDHLGDINRDRIVIGFELFKATDHYKDFIDDNCDLYTADVLLQFVVMGKIVFS